MPLKLVNFLIGQGHNALHVNELPDKWFTADSEICHFADQQNLIVITKDKDFRNSFLLNRTPRKLVRIALGNISNQYLIQRIEDQLSFLALLNIQENFYLELGETTCLYTFD